MGRGGVCWVREGRAGNNGPLSLGTSVCVCVCVCVCDVNKLVIQELHEF